MLIFMLAIYVITAIGEKMSNERVAELNKRKDIQEDFKNVVTNLYEVFSLKMLKYFIILPRLTFDYTNA